jgi:hypothetical protein
LAEGLARAVELLSAEVHAMPVLAGDVEPFVRFVIQIAVAALSLRPTCCATSASWRPASGGRLGPDRIAEARPGPAWWPGPGRSVSQCAISPRD